MHDRMTEEIYKSPLRSFSADVTPAPVYTVPLLEKGRSALEDINEELGLGFDEWQDARLQLIVLTASVKCRSQRAVSPSRERLAPE